MRHLTRFAAASALVTLALGAAAPAHAVSGSTDAHIIRIESVGSQRLVSDAHIIRIESSDR